MQEKKLLINFRATKEEKEILKQKAKKNRQSLTQYMLSKGLECQEKK